MKGFGNIGQLMKQAQEMQKNVQKAQEELEQETVTASAGGGMVEVTMTGKNKVKKITLKKEAVDPDDIEMLEDLLLAALNDAANKVEEMVASKMGGAGIPSGSVPGLF